MRSASMFFVLLLSSASLAAQTPASGDAAAQFTLPAPAAIQSCPVRLSVDRRPDGEVIWASGNEPARHGQGLDITVANSLKSIISADIVVYGYPAGSRVVPATSLSPQEVTETFHLTASAGHPLVGSPVWTQRLVIVNRIELTRIQYADGTVWQPSSKSRCTASPSLFVLVDSAPAASNSK